MKIVRSDNFSREMISDVLVCGGITEERYGTTMVEALNAAYSDDDADVYFKLVKDEYELYEFKP